VFWYRCPRAQHIEIGAIFLEKPCIRRRGINGTTILPYSPTSNPVLIIPIIIAVLVYFLLRMYLTWRETKATRAHIKKSLPNKTNTQKKEMDDIVKLFGFNPDQEQFFRTLCVECKISNPVQFVHDPKAVEAAFGKKLQLLDNLNPPKPDTEKMKTTLFMVREMIDHRIQSGKNWTSTRAIHKQQIFTLIAPTGEHYSSSVLENTDDGIVAVLPRDISGNELRLPTSAKIEIFFTAGMNKQAYRFRSRVIRYVADDSSTRLLLAHSKQLEALPVRKHERKSTDIACTFSSVQVANVVNGKQTMHKFFPEKKAYNGKILEISVGGCSIETDAPLAMNAYLQIQCGLEPDSDDTMIGKVIRLGENMPGGLQTMNIQFVQLPRITMNRIFRYIYT